MPDPYVVREGDQLPPEVAARFAAYDYREPKSSGPKIALGLTMQRQVDAKLFIRWMHVLRSHWWPGPVYNSRAGFGAAMSRNLVLHQFFQDVEAGADLAGLLFWDSDQVPPTAIPGPLSWGDPPWQGGYFTEYLQWLLENEKAKQLFGGLYFSREDRVEVAADGRLKALPHDPVAYWSEGEGYRPLTPPELIPMLQRPALYEVRAVGTGSMLIRTELLRRMRDLKAPGAIFEAPEVRAASGVGPVGTQWTEDVFFCHEVRNRLNERIYLDTTMQSVHIAEIWISSKNWLETHGYVSAPHPQTAQAHINKARENERRQGRIILPG